MDVLPMVRYLNSKDGPHMTLAAIAPYLGVGESTLCEYLSGKYKPSKQAAEKMEKGMRELLGEIMEEWNGLCNRYLQQVE